MDGAGAGGAAPESRKQLTAAEAVNHKRQLAQMVERELALTCGVPQFQLPQRTPGQTRQARGGRQRPPGGAWAGPGAHCGVGPAWVLGGFFLPSASPISARDRLAAHNL